MTEKQIGVLVRAGIPTHGLDRGQASAIIDVLMTRAREGRCTYKQARTLIRFDYDPNVAFADGSKVVTSLAANGWQRLAALVTV